MPSWAPSWVITAAYLDQARYEVAEGPYGSYRIDRYEPPRSPFEDWDHNSWAAEAVDAEAATLLVLKQIGRETAVCRVVDGGGRRGTLLIEGGRPGVPEYYETVGEAVEALNALRRSHGLRWIVPSARSRDLEDRIHQIEEEEWGLTVRDKIRMRRVGAEAFHQESMDPTDRDLLERDWERAARRNA